jgi:catechol 2,3-dioxygenase-like lactoylglutathione lyase family enzyme
MPDFDRLSEVILYVQDIERMTSFYTDVFGLDIVAGDPDHGFVEFDTGSCSLCLHAGGDGDLGREAPKFVFAVEDIEAARSHLEERDVELGDVRSPAPGVEVCDGRDPEGNKFSIESSTVPE